MRRLSLLIALLLTAWPVQGQVVGGARIAGTVTDSQTGAPLGDAHVFISGSTSGTVSAPDGTFLLTGVPLGANRIVISRVGYLRQGHDVVVRRPIQFAMDFQVDARIVPLEGIVVTAERDGNWDRQLEEFTLAFLGRTDRARQATIVNPEVLSFSEDGDLLTARAEQPIEVINAALGYRVLYFLRTFQRRGDRTRHEGEALFSEMIPESEAQRAAWDRERLAAFRGSSRHLFRELFDGQTREAGFFLYTSDEPRPPRQDVAYRQNQAAPFRKPQFAMEPGSLTSDGPSARERYVSFPQFIEVVYTKETEDRVYRAWQGLPEPTRDDYQRSWIKLTRDEVLIDMEGSILDAYGVEYYGYMAFERLADLVPKEFRPLSGTLLGQRD